MGKLVGTIVDKATGQPIEAKVNVISQSGTSMSPPNAIMKVGPGTPFFYSDGKFTLDVNRGPARITVERGTEYIPATMDVDMPITGTVNVDFQIEKWTDLKERGWHPGNTHIHYDEKEKRPDDRLKFDPRVEDLRMTAVSILKRGNFEYASNKYYPGMLLEFSSTDYYVQCGEENRHNCLGAHDTGYGHIMLLSLRNIVEPVSRGMFIDAFDPDYPPLSYACDDTHRQGGIVIWCHNGKGMELPVAAGLGKVDAFNVGDPSLGDREYSMYHNMLNAGIRLPISTGSDWFICNANRVYAHTGGPFTYDAWVAALKAGKTFMTNGPAIFFTANGKEMGEEIQTSPEKPITAAASWKSHYPVNKVEILYNGNVVISREYVRGSTEGRLDVDFPATANGWMAARVSSYHRNSYFHPVYGHTSPIYVKTGVDGPEKREAAELFVKNIDLMIDWVKTRGKFYKDSQREEIVDLHLQGREVYRKML